MNEVLVVIGVGGMGEAITRRSAAGRQVLLADFNLDLLSATQTRLAGDGFRVRTHPADVSSAGSVAELASAADELGQVTGAVHTAGLSPAQAPAESIVRVDLLGVAHFLDAFAGVIAPGGAGVVIASLAGTMTAGQLPAELEAALAATPTGQLSALPFLRSEALTDPGAAYALSKRANQLRVQAASLAWGSRGARVNSISPGVISTPMGQQELASEQGAQMRALLAGSALGHPGTASDIAAAAAFLLSPDASFITGTDLLVDGGVVAGVRNTTQAA